MANSMAKTGEPDRPAEGWKYPYVAGVVDYGTNIRLAVQQADDRAVGYSINVTLGISNTDRTALGFLDEFCEQHGIEPNHREDKNSYRLEISKRDDLKLFLRLVRPYLIARHAEAEILLKNLLPGLELGKASSEDGFVELIGYVDEIREETGGSAHAKYDEAHFREEWDL